jgi:hypothetical protein
MRLVASSPGVCVGAPCELRICGFSCGETEGEGSETSDWGNGVAVGLVRTRFGRDNDN